MRWVSILFCTVHKYISEENERLPDMTPNGMFLDVSLSPKEKSNKDTHVQQTNKHLILIR